MDWQPIETAPKDGSVVLLYYATRFAPSTKCRGVGWFAQEHGEWDTDGSYRVLPSHWMPLPQPPVSGAVE